MDLKIGNVIRKLRTQHSVTQEVLAAYLGISFQAVSKWETGATMPDITLLPKLAAGHMLEKAMEESPLDEEIYFLYRSVRGGNGYKPHSDNDWFISVCEPYARKYTQDRHLYFMLIEAMTGKKYFDRAEELLKAVKFEGENRYMKEVLLGDIAL